MLAISSSSSSQDATRAERLSAVVVVGASAGGIPALERFVAGLPADYDGVVLVVLHLAPEGTSVLPTILGRSTTLPARFAVDGEPLTPGVVLCAPPNHHLLVHAGQARLTRTPRENGHRPSIDVAMRSAAHSAGVAAVGVVLSGMRDDGAAGLIAIARHGGRCLVQKPDEAQHPGMPNAALQSAPVDAVLPVGQMGEWIVSGAARTA